MYVFKGSLMACFLIRFVGSIEWGVATSAYQVEGFTDTDGRTASIWDTFVNEVPSPVVDQSTGYLASQSYNLTLLLRDFDWLQSLNVTNYRLSLSWSRLFPSMPSLNNGIVNTPAQIYYQNVIDALKERGIRPWVTLFHWDLPTYAPGWENEVEMLPVFEAYVRNVFSLFNTTVDRWFTLNEPYTVVSLGYEIGAHAPGIQNPQLARQAAQTMLKAHVVAYDYFHNNQLDGKIGIALNCDYFEGTDEVSKERANHEMISRLAWFMDPLIYHHYPTELSADLSGFTFDSYAFAPDRIYMDFVALNTYSAFQLSNGGYTWSAYPGSTAAASRWLNAYPDGIPKLIDWMYDRYGNAFPQKTEFVISENGFSTHPWEFMDANTRGMVIQGSKDCVEQLTRKYESEGRLWDITTYFVWSYIDNFEWAAGYTERFGLLSWDETTRTRCEKESVNFLFPNRFPRDIYPTC